MGQPLQHMDSPQIVDMDNRPTLKILQECSSRSTTHPLWPTVWLLPSYYRIFLTITPHSGIYVTL
jgi:hypothetical protein